MAVAVYDTTKEMVKQRLPFDTASIGAGTQPLSDEDIDEFIEKGASHMSGVLVSVGLSTTLADDDTKAQVQAAIIEYAVWECLRAIPNVEQSRILAAEEAWLQRLRRYAGRKEFLKTQADNKTRSNVDTSSTKTAKTFSGIDYEF